MDADFRRLRRPRPRLGCPRMRRSLALAIALLAAEGAQLAINGQIFRKDF